jgi:NAD(P) transhydrogenase subunit beta
MGMPLSGFSWFIQIVYLLSAILFIFGIKRLSSPATARSGNQLAALGMFLAISATFLTLQSASFFLLFIGILVGSILGLMMAYQVKMTDMPQVVAVFNGMGGGAAALVEIAEFLHKVHNQETFLFSALLPMLIGTVIGCVTFTGSFIAFGKLQGILNPRASTSIFLKALTALATLVILIALVTLLTKPLLPLYLVLIFASLLLGVVMVVPIGGADMPVVISLLNSYTGLSVAFAGFVLQNNLLVVAGTLVGASGTLLTQLMCKAMNRSLVNVLFGAFGAHDAGKIALAGAAGTNGSIKEISLQDAAILLAYARRAIIVPGYGLAVAQAQHQIRDLADALEKRGVEVKYAIHPVAGRMPGHMNVLLAEANVPYSQLVEMDEINPEFSRTDVVLVVGANDVVNPAARNSKTSPIYGMPILDVDQAEKIIVLKRSMNPGFAGIENELFYNPKTYMLFGDAKATLQKLTAELKAL